ncbi:MAG: hypothetical protein BM555_07015 [Crocinitomix sp. MedPE-SWsnd]|jgi:hypothetical protein|nr:MAG: hypothetical protein BM555_07015 [Crocinitomix sp. MedPE-SWsnd]
MKKLLLISAIALSFTSSAQVWFDLGAKGGVGSGFALNSVVNEDGRLGVSPGFNYFFGGKVGVNFGEFVGVTFDVDYGSYKYGFTQSDVLGKPATETFKYKLSYNAINFSPYFRYTKEASYLEIGPNFSFTRNPLIEDEAYQILQPNPAEAINSKLTGLTFGFGGHMVGNETISLMMGLRFNYTFSNLTSQTYEDTSFPFTNYLDITEPTSTNPLNVQLVMEINYSLGYFVKASCGRRTAFLTF